MVEVLWEDASSASSWSEANAMEPLHCVTVGILVKRDKHAIHLVGAINEGGQYAERWRIPAGMIRKVRVIGKMKLMVAA